ncbi:MAG: hypothetical protein U0Y08_14965 [Bacteroidia bacterium]
MTFTELLNNYGEDAVNRIIDTLSVHNKFASGQLKESLKHELSLDVDNLNFEIEFSAIEYERFIRSGRRAGNGVKPPPYQAIETWAKFKGIPLQYVVPIQKGIAVTGIKSFDFIDIVFTDKNVTELGNSVSSLLQKEITDKIKTSIE